jgi:preprotein translocase subunit SecE
MKKVREFLNECQAELKKVTWPNMQILKRTTVLVIFLMVLMALYLGVVDVIFSRLLRVFVR